VKRAAFFALLFVVAIFCLSPLVWQAITSLKTSAEITKIPPYLPHSPSLDNYRSVFTNHPFFKLLWNSFVVALFSTCLSLFFGSLAAFGFSHLRIRGASALLMLILAASMFPPIATVSPLYLLFRMLQLRDTLLALILTYTTFSLPLTIWVLTNFFKNIPDDLFSAARVDGCTNWQSFYKVMLPVSAPGIAATAILVFIFCWNEFLYALTFTSTIASRTVPVGIALFAGIYEVPFGEMAAASVTVTIPLVILVFAFQKKIVEGLTSGAVKS